MLSNRLIRHLSSSRIYHRRLYSTATNLGAGEMGIEPLRRHGESNAIKRARLLHQSRKRGIKENDLIMSTFAQRHLANMTARQLDDYDRFLDENDWDVYYWVTQADKDEGQAMKEVQEGKVGNGHELGHVQVVGPPQSPPRPGEWAQTKGTFRAAYKPVPERWSESESDILGLLRKHMRDQDGGMRFMPELAGGKERS